MTGDPGPQPVLANVLVLRLRDGDAQDAAERARLREKLAEQLRTALAGWPPERRVVLDAPRGFAVAGEVDEAVALEAAVRLLHDGADVPAAIGLHRGAVRAVQGGEAATRITGDGLDTAAAIAAMPDAPPIAASQAFRDALAASAPRLASELRPAGELVDAALRSHALYAHDPVAAGRQRLRRGLLAAAGIVLVLGAGQAAREARESYEAAHRPALIHLDIRPGGEVYVDGERKGAAPQLAKLWVPPGPHAIEVRNGRFKPLRMEVQLQPGEAIQVKHVFAAPPAPRAPARRPPPPNLIDQMKSWWKAQQA